MGAVIQISTASNFIWTDGGSGGSVCLAGMYIKLKGLLMSKAKIVEARLLTILTSICFPVLLVKEGLRQDSVGVQYLLFALAVITAFMVVIVIIDSVHVFRLFLKGEDE